MAKSKQVASGGRSLLLLSTAIALAPVSAFAIDAGIGADAEYVVDALGVATWVVMFGLGFVAAGFR